MGTISQEKPGSRRGRGTKSETYRSNESGYQLNFGLETPRRGPCERERLARHLLSAWKRDPERIRSFDRDRDGEISVAEWEEARAQARGVADRAERRVQAEPPLPRVQRTDDPRHPFVISTLGERALLRRLRLWALGGTTGFLVLTAGVSLAVLARVG